VTGGWVVIEPHNRFLERTNSDGLIKVHFYGFETLVELWAAIDKFVRANETDDPELNFEMDNPWVDQNPVYDNDGNVIADEGWWQMFGHYGYT